MGRKLFAGDLPLSATEENLAACGTDFDDRSMRVNEAKPQSKAGAGGRGGFGGGGRW